MLAAGWRGQSIGDRLLEAVEQACDSPSRRIRWPLGKRNVSRARRPCRFPFDPDTDTDPDPDLFAPTAADHWRKE
jgi:hypothetical protein